jgi:serine phosphatase RsbU (regulator of sigma subunit)
MAKATVTVPGVLGEGTRDTRLLVVEDDDGDALLVEELLADSGEPFTMLRVTSIGAAVEVAPGHDCALVDLGLPDAEGIEAVLRLRDRAPDLAIVVLTGLDDRERGTAAVGAGAQDYLVKGQVDGFGLAKSVRFAIERRRAERDGVRLLLTERRQAENDRLARGLLPVLDVDGPRLEAVTRYRPGADALLGGDFYDAIVLADGTVRAVIGDVCGHGPDEAAVGVALRIAWRTMVLTGATPEATLAAVDRVLRDERDQVAPFVTLCDLTIDPVRLQLVIRRHGHPPPLLLTPEAAWLDETMPAPPLGISTHADATPVEVPLPEHWSLLLLTDGIYEGRAGTERLGMDGLIDLLRRQGAPESPAALLDSLIAVTTALHGGDLDDDVALVWLGTPR